MSHVYLRSELGTKGPGLEIGQGQNNSCGWCWGSDYLCLLFWDYHHWLYVINKSHLLYPLMCLLLPNNNKKEPLHSSNTVSYLCAQFYKCVTQRNVNLDPDNILSSFSCSQSISVKWTNPCPISTFQPHSTSPLCWSYLLPWASFSAPACMGRQGLCIIAKYFAARLRLRFGLAAGRLCIVPAPLLVRIGAQHDKELYSDSEKKL